MLRSYTVRPEPVTHHRARCACGWASGLCPTAADATAALRTHASERHHNDTLYDDDSLLAERLRSARCG